MKKQLLIALVGTFTLTASAQNSSADFKPNGKVEGKIFTDFSSTITNNKVNNAFELTRAYFGYTYNMSPMFSGKVLLDMGTTSDGKPTAYTAYVKNAFGQYAYENLNVKFGLIGTTSFGLQESLWGKRYLYKSFQDQYGFSSSADLGASATYRLASFVSADLSVFNGEGYKKMQVDSALQVALGVTFQPIKNLYIRAYGDYLPTTSYKNATGKVAQSSLNGLVAYKTDKFSLGAEYNLQNGNANVKNHNFSGISVYGDYNFSKQLGIFGRFDKLTSANSWSNAKDGEVYIGGIQYMPVKGISIAPNVQYSNFANNTTKTVAALNVEVKF